MADSPLKNVQSPEDSTVVLSPGYLGGQPELAGEGIDFEELILEARENQAQNFS